MVDQIWENKPTYSKNPVFIHPIEFAGDSVETKIERSEVTKDKKLLGLEGTNSALLVSTLDDIAWLLNLRGDDISFNPLFISYLIVFLEDRKVFLYADQDKFTPQEIQEHLKVNKIELKSFNTFKASIKTFSKDFPNYTLILDSTALNQDVAELVENNVKNYQFYNYNIIQYTKYKKTPREIQGLRDCNIRDASALVRYFAWLENRLLVDKTPINEYDAAVQSKNFRAKEKSFKGESFHCISCTGKNAAIIHYSPTPESSDIIDKNEIYLIDSGGQYFDGTTDTTRTLHFGTPTAKMKEMYSRVLMGNLSIERLLFNSKTLKGSSVDCIARQYLMHVGKNYGHGTGHGVGYFLCVHEGPNGIGSTVAQNSVSFEPGYVTSNEPGYYEEGAFGIRIENVITVIDKGTGLYGFENFTLLPYENTLFDLNVLSPDFITFINDFHAKVWTEISPLIKDDPLALDYLTRKTKAI